MNISYFDSELTLKYLADRAKIFRNSCWAETTRASLTSSQRTFIAFCRKFHITEFSQVTGDLLVTYAVWLVVSVGLTAVGSIKNYLSHVRTLCRMYGHDCHTPKSYAALDWTLTGIRRELQTPSQRKDPITPEILKFLITFPADLTSLSWEQRVLFLTIRSFYKIAYFTMLRASNLLTSSKAKTDPRRQITWGRTRSVPGGAIIDIILSKTQQFGDRTHEIALPEAPGSIYCPVSALRQLFDLRAGQCCSSDDLIFMIPSGGKWVPLTKHTVLDIMRAQLSRASFDPTRFAFHSLRRGGIQTAVQVQPSLELIRCQTGHASDAIHCYTQLPGEARLATGSRMLEAMTLI